jgi:hypothetical protein
VGVEKSNTKPLRKSTPVEKVNASFDPALFVRCGERMIQHGARGMSEEQDQLPQPH